MDLNYENDNDLFRGVGVEVKLKDADNFLKIKETLTRIGVPSKTNDTLYQSCHILHKRDGNGDSRYAIVHFKEMFKLDGRPSSFELKDVERRNTIVKLLKEWNLIDILDTDSVKETMPMSAIKVIPYKDKDKWSLVAKYNIGRKKR